MMKNELAFEFVEFDVLPIQFGRDIGLPIFMDLPKFLCNVHFLHSVLDEART
jgi:hypothetical protein